MRVGRYIPAGLAALLLAGAVEAGERRVVHDARSLPETILSTESSALHPAFRKHFDINSMYETLDGVVRDAAPRIDPEQPKKTLTSLRSLMLERFALVQAKEGDRRYDWPLLYHLAMRELDCSSMAHLFVIIGEAYRLPITMTNLPNHIVVVWQQPTGNLYYDAVAGRVLPSEPAYFVDTFGISFEDIQHGIYLSPWKREEILAMVYFEMGNRLLREHRFKKAREAYEHALALNPSFPDAQQNKDVVLDVLRKK